jgi:triosephosphate isomerase
MIFVNFKTYENSSGEKAKALATFCSEVSLENRIEVIACPQSVDFRAVQNILPKLTWTQHVDLYERGRATGWLPPEIAIEAGAVGTLLNHSEHKLLKDELGKIMNRCRKIGLKTLIFADSMEEAVAVSEFKPDYIGYEPPELVGSDETSVSRSKPQVIEEVVKAVPGIPILVGAGVKDSEDVRVGLKLGAVGIAVASGVVKAQNQKQALLELALGFKK